MKEPDISVVIPLYNEENRILQKLGSYTSFLAENFSDYEIIFVDDGSTDLTREVMEKIADSNKNIKNIFLPENKGRGFAMKTGVLASKGKYILETDADLPVPALFIGQFVQYLNENKDIDMVVGSRGVVGSKFIVKQTAIRILAGHVFHLIFNNVFQIKTKDVMCGFKMFRNRAAKEVFAHVYDNKFLAAAEIIFVAKKLKFKCEELPVVWEDNRHSKVHVFRDSIITIYGIFKMIWRDLVGKYK